MKPGYSGNAYSIVRNNYPDLTEQEFKRVWETFLYNCYMEGRKYEH